MVSLVTLEWLARQVGVKRGSRTMQILVPLLVEGRCCAELPRLMQIRELTARKVIARFKRRVAVRMEALQAEIAGLPSLEQVEALLKSRSLGPERRQELLEWRAVLSDAKRLAATDGLLAASGMVRAPEQLTVRQEARVLLQALSGHLRSAPPTPTYDANGRQVGGGAKLVTLDDVEDIILGRGVQRYAPPADYRGWRIGPVR